MNAKDIASSLKEPDMYNFEKKLREALHELSLKRSLLEESRKELNQAFLVKYDLERRLDKTCRELEESQVQLELTISAGRKWEEEREAIPLHRAQLQATLAERDTLKEHSRSLQVENIELKSKVEELEGQMHCLSTLQNGAVALQSEVEEVIREVKRQAQCLSQDQKRLEGSVKAATNMGARLELMSRHNMCIQEKMKEHLQKMEAKVVTLATELDQVKNDAKSLPQKQSTQEPQGMLLNEWKSSIHEMEGCLQSSEECKKKLKKALESAVQASARLGKELKAAKEENILLVAAKKEAESHLKELLKNPPVREISYKDKEVQVDCSLVEVSCLKETYVAAFKADSLSHGILECNKTEE